MIVWELRLGQGIFFNMWVRWSRQWYWNFVLSFDFYWSLTKRFERLSLSLVALNTEVEWSLQGKCENLSTTTAENLILGDKVCVSWIRTFLGTGKFRYCEQRNWMFECDKTGNNWRIQLLYEVRRWKILCKVTVETKYVEKLASNREVARKCFEDLIRFKNSTSFLGDYKVIDEYCKETIIDKLSFDNELCSEPSFVRTNQ